MADPTFLGYFIDKGVSAAAKVVRKVNNFVFSVLFFFKRNNLYFSYPTICTFNLASERVGNSCNNSNPVSAQDAKSDNLFLLFPF